MPTTITHEHEKIRRGPILLPFPHVLSAEKTEKVSCDFFVVFNGVCVDIDGKNVDGHESEKKKNGKLEQKRNFSFSLLLFFGGSTKYIQLYRLISDIYFRRECFELFILQYFILFLRFESAQVAY